MSVTMWSSVREEEEGEEEEEEDGLVRTVLMEGLGPTLATVTRQQLLWVSHGSLCTAVLALTALHLHLLCTQPLSPGISVCTPWNKVHKVLELIVGGFLLLFYLRQEGNYASCIRSEEIELLYYLVLMKAEQMG